MATPVRLQLSRKKGFNLQAWSREVNGLEAVKVTRPGKWGNPFDFRSSEYCWAALALGERGDALGRQSASVKAFREWINPGDGKRTVSSEFQVKLGEANRTIDLGPRVSAGMAPAIDEIVSELRGKNLACWCKLPKRGEPDICHAAVLLELANRPICEANPSLEITR